MMAEKLKPCPFCGGESTIVVSKYLGDTFYKPVCVVCGAEINYQFETRKCCIKAWNRRVE